MGAASRGATGKPCCADDRRSAYVVAKLGPARSFPRKAWSHFTCVGRTRCPACRSRAHLGFAGGSGSAAWSRRRSGASSNLGISCGSSGLGAELGCGRARVATRRGRARMGRAAASNLPATRPRWSRAVMGSAGRARGPGCAAVCPRVANAQRAFVEPTRSCVGGPETGSLRALCAPLHRLGRPGARRRRATAHRRPVMGDARCATAFKVSVAGME